MNPRSIARRMAALLLLNASVPVLAEPAGVLDPTFATDGKQTVAFNLEGSPSSLVKYDDDMRAMAMAPGGRIYLAGILRRAINNYAVGVSRLRHDGTPDPAFGTNGRVVIDVVDGENAVLAATVQPDGKLLVAGWVKASGETNASTLVCRIRTSGSLDPSFGTPQTPGCRIFAASTSQFSQAVLVQRDGRIVLAVRRNAVGTMLMRLRSDGSDDATFGVGGTALLSGQFSDSGLLSIDQMPDGDLVAAGYTRRNSFDEDDVLLFRVDEHGSPEETFGAGGAKVITVNAGSSVNRRGDFATRVHALADGSLVATGLVESDNNPGVDPARSYKMLALRLEPDGELDNTFGGGIRLYDPCLAPCSSASFDSVVLPDGRIVLGGWMRDPTTYASEFLAMRLLPNGDPDEPFGEYSAGVASIDFALVAPNVSVDSAERIALDGARLVLAGTATVPTAGDSPSVDTDFAVARLDHGLDQTFFEVSSESLGNGTLSPAEQQIVKHSDHVDFELIPAPGHMIRTIQGCDGALYGKVYTTGPIVADCTVTATFKPKAFPLFLDGF